MHHPYGVVPHMRACTSIMLRMLVTRRWVKHDKRRLRLQASIEPGVTATTARPLPGRGEFMSPFVTQPASCRSFPRSTEKKHSEPHTHDGRTPPAVRRSTTPPPIAQAQHHTGRIRAPTNDRTTQPANHRVQAGLRPPTLPYRRYANTRVRSAACMRRGSWPCSSSERLAALLVPLCDRHSHRSPRGPSSFAGCEPFIPPRTTSERQGDGMHAAPTTMHGQVQ